MKLLFFLFLSLSSVSTTGYAQRDSLIIPYKPAKTVKNVYYFHVWRGVPDKKAALIGIQQVWWDTLAVHTRRNLLNDLQEWIDAERKKLPPVSAKE